MNVYVTAAMFLVRTSAYDAAREVRVNDLFASHLALLLRRACVRYYGAVMAGICCIWGV